MYNKNIRSKLLLIISAVIFGTIGIFRRYIPIGSATLAFSRGFTGALFLSLVAFISGKRLSVKAIKGNFLILIVSGAFLGLNWLFLFEAYKYTSVAVATLCYYMAPIFVIPASALILREKPSLKKILSIILAFIGMILVSGIFSKTKSQNGFKGIFFGLTAAVLYAGIIILNKKLKNINPYDKTVSQLIIAAVVILPYALLKEAPVYAGSSIKSIVLILFVGIVHTGIAYLLYFASIKNLSAQTVAVFSYIDPIVALLLSVVILKESMNVFEAMGAVLILGAACNEIFERRE